MGSLLTFVNDFMARKKGARRGMRKAKLENIPAFDAESAVQSFYSFMVKDESWKHSNGLQPR
jgi:hypothetical protein